MIIALKHQTLEPVLFENEADALNAGNNHIIIADEAALDRTGMSKGELATIYNTIKPDKPIKKFKDRRGAVRRTFAALQKHFGIATSAASESDESVTTEEDSEMVETPKKKVKKPKKIAKAPKIKKPKKIEKVAKALLKKVAKSIKVKKPKKVAKAPKPAKAKRASFMDSLVTPTAKGNQFREGSISFKSFQKVVDKPGLVFRDYVKKRKVNQGVLARAIRLGYAKMKKQPAA